MYIVVARHGLSMHLQPKYSLYMVLGHQRATAKWTYCNMLVDQLNGCSALYCDLDISSVNQIDLRAVSAYQTQPLETGANN